MQVPKHLGAKRQVYPIPPKLFAPNQDLDIQRQRHYEQQQLAAIVEQLHPESTTDASAMTSSKSTSGRSQKLMSKSNGTPFVEIRKTHVSDVEPNPTVPARFLRHTASERLPSNNLSTANKAPPQCPPGVKCRTCNSKKKTTSTDVVRDSDRLCYWVSL
jgi:hypothetical protein